MGFPNFNLNNIGNIASNLFSFLPVQNTTSSGRVDNIFGTSSATQLLPSLATNPLMSNGFYNYWNNNQSELQFMMLQSIMEILSNPLINHTPTAEINNNFRPYDYNRYNISGLFTLPDFDIPDFKPVTNTNTNNINTNYNISDFGSNAQKISQLDPEMQEKTMQLLDYAKSKGLTVQITSGYRTQEEQQELLRTRPQFAAKRSAHCEGKAIDINIVGGTDADYKMLGDYAKSIGMRWGGDFSKVKERWHFDYNWA